MTVVQLQRALEIKREMEKLQAEIDELSGLASKSPARIGGAAIIPAGHRKIARAQRARWAKFRAKNPHPKRRRYKMSAAGRAAIVADQRRRWAGPAAR